MNNVYDFYRGSSFVTTLKETSKDARAAGFEKPAYMTESLRPVVDFDQVKDDYVRRLNAGLDPIPQSVDALFAERDDLVLVEFKNGKLDGKKRAEVRKKVYDSLLILGDEHGLTIGKLREKGVFVLVYNPEVNLEGQNDMQPSKTKLGHHLFSLAKTRLVGFGMKRFEGYCFREVHTLTADEFNQSLFAR